METELNSTFVIRDMIMCGRGVRSTEPETLRTRFSTLFKSGPAFLRTWNLAPAAQTPIVRSENGERTMVMVRWGLVPSWWSKPLNGLPMMANARAETLMERPAFRTLLARRRCIMPLDAFYEWKRVGKTKQPYAFALKSRDTMGMAALWDHWIGAGTGEVIESCTLITVPPNDLVAPIHDRMPAILRREDYDLWLDHGAPIMAARDLLKPYPAEEMECWPVDNRVNTQRYDEPSLLEAVPV